MTELIINVQDEDVPTIKKILEKFNGVCIDENSPEAQEQFIQAMNEGKNNDFLSQDEKESFIKHLPDEA